MSTELFRKKALSKYLRVDAPGAILTITPPWAITVFGAMALLFALLLGIAAFGKVQLAAEGRGVMRPNEPLVVVRAPFSGTVLYVSPSARAAAEAQTVVVTMDVRAETKTHDRCVVELEADRTELGSLEKRMAEWNDSAAKDRDAAMALVLISQLRSQREKTTSLAQRCDALGTTIERSNVVLPVDGTIADLAVSAGAQVHEGDVLFTLVPAHARLVGYVALGEQYRSELTPDLPVRVKFDALPYDEVGVANGHVTRVLEELPTGVKVEPTQPASQEATVFAEIALYSMPAGAGPARSGMTFTADVLTQRRTVLSLLFGSANGN